MKKITLFLLKSTTDKLNLKELSAGQLEFLADNNQAIEKIIFNSEEDYLKQKENLNNILKTKDIKKVLMIINNDEDKYKREKEVQNV